jgi:hypothetical protein
MSVSDEYWVKSTEENWNAANYSAHGDAAATATTKILTFTVLMPRLAAPLVLPDSNRRPVMSRRMFTMTAPITARTTRKAQRRRPQLHRPPPWAT